MTWLVVGLGNPGADHAKTRHNLGFLAVEEVAERHGWKWKESSKFCARIAKGEGVVLVEPLTYMNSSGEAVRRAADFYKVGLERILVVCDDVALPFGELRLRPQGSPGGHNGLKSIQAHLGSGGYPRLRMGIEVGERFAELEDFVLGRFSKGEEEQLVEFVGRAADVIEAVVGEPLEDVMKSVNTRKRNGSEGA